MIQELSNFRQIWDAFLMPVISSIVIFVFITILYGKNFLYELYRKYGFVKISNKYYKHKYIRVNKEKKVILLPISKEMENIIVKLQKPVIIIPLVLVISYILYQLIGIIDTLYPVSYFYTSPNNLLYSVPKYTIAEIWTYFPEYNIENLNTKINIWGEECSYAKYYDYSGILLIGSVCKFCSLLCIIKFFICRTHIKEYLRTNPDVYIESNLIGFYNILEACRHSYDDGANGVEHLVYASSSSVYGSNKKVPYATEDKVDNPVSLYAATKKSNELMAHAYSKLYNIPSTGLRFFTVYGPAGRPDMAYFGFTNKLRAGDTIQIFNYGNCKRDFTYVDDIVEGVKRVMQAAPEKKNGEDGLPIPPYAVYNIGNSHPENLLEFVDILQQELISAGVLPEDYDFDAHKKLVPMQPGDVPVTYADTTALEEDFGFKPQTSLREGLRKFAQWYAEFYK